MTVDSKVKQTAASLKGAKATLQIYAEQNERKDNREAFERNAHRLERVITRLEDRMFQLEFEEPQYKGF